MITFGFCLKMFCSGFFIVVVASFIAESFYFDDHLLSRVVYWSTTIVGWISVVCTVMSIFGMIWTF